MKDSKKTYRRYQIDTKHASNIISHPNRFQVRVDKLALAKLLIKELIHYRGNLDILLSRPCIYGVFSGPVGGFSPRENLCVGCLRCTTQYPEMVKITHNPKHQQQGDSFFTVEHVDATVYEAENGRIPIKGAGYRGKFGGTGWDGMWTDMSEIVRPTRDGIHGREFISTEIDLGKKVSFLLLDENFKPLDPIPKTLSLPVPLLFDTPPLALQSNETLCRILVKAAQDIQTLSILPLKSILDFSLTGSHIIPLVDAKELPLLKNLPFKPLMVEMAHWNENLYQEIRSCFPSAFAVLRTNYEQNLIPYYGAGVRIFHLTANYHGRGKNNRFVLDLIRKAHLSFVEAGTRDEVALIGSGGIIAAEHLPKAIICGLDGAAIDTPLLVSLQAKFGKKSIDPEECDFTLPKNLSLEWGTQRLKNLVHSWRDQLIEMLGAMGLREVRRLRGEIGRAMFQKDLEKEAFNGIAVYDAQ